MWPGDVNLGAVLHTHTAHCLVPMASDTNKAVANVGSFLVASPPQTASGEKLWLVNVLQPTALHLKLLLLADTSFLIWQHSDPVQNGDVFVDSLGDNENTDADAAVLRGGYANLIFAGQTMTSHLSD